MYFLTLAQTFEQIEKITARLEITAILAKVFRESEASDIGKICYLLQGRVAPLYEPIEFGLANKFVEAAIAQAYGVDRDAVAKEFKKLGDYGSAAQAIGESKIVNHESKRNISIQEVFVVFEEITKTNGEGSQEKKISELSGLLARVEPLCARYIVRIPLGKLRLGFSDMTILDALSWMLTGDKQHRELLEDAYSKRPDIGYIATLTKEKGIKGLDSVHMQVGAPVLPSLCQRLPTADEMIEKMGEVSVDPKYDGVRIQIHFVKNPSTSPAAQSVFIRSYSRNLEETSAMFPELMEIGSELDAESVVLDAEAVGLNPKTGAILPFQETMTRKRKHGIAEAQQSVPIRFFVFDILHKDGKDLLDVPLSERRAILEHTLKHPKHLHNAPHIITRDAGEIREFHEKQLAQGLEGVVVKKWNSPYEPGRKGFSWVKFKEEEGKKGMLIDTIDCVVMGYTRGEGKRASFGVGQLLLGIRDGDTFVTFTKLGSGTTEADLTMLQQQLNELMLPEKPSAYINVNKAYTPDVWVRPQMVLEIAGDTITKTKTHGAGYSVRFPRLVRIRSDKSPQEATTVAEVVKIGML